MAKANGSVDGHESHLDYVTREGIPQHADPFIQKYMQGRSALIAQEKKQRHDYIFKHTMSPLAKQASKIMASIRRRELKTIWTSDYEETLADQNGGNLYPGMMFTLARSRMEATDLFRIIERMPKGALLHAHLDAMIDIDWLIDQVLAEKGLCIQAPAPLDTPERRTHSSLQIRYWPEESISQLNKANSIWSPSYTPNTPIPIRYAQQSFPDHSQTFKSWLNSRCTISTSESLSHHHGLDAIWRKFQSCFLTIGELLFYEPIFRRALLRLLHQLVADKITYIDFRLAFRFDWRPSQITEPDPCNADGFFKAFSEIISTFKQTSEAKAAHFTTARMIWTNIRSAPTPLQAEQMKTCIRLKRLYPAYISGFDFVGQEDPGRTLQDLTPLVFWFRKKCLEAGVEIPFFFHAGECLGDGDGTDNNLFDAILLGTRRIGHGYSLYKHPLLVDMVKDKKILVESCPISNEILRLSSSILSHSLPALLSRGVACSLSNDDPAILGHGKNGLSHDFWQAYMAWENLGLEGLGCMAENSLKWSAAEDAKQGEWVKGVGEGYMGKTLKARMLKEWRSDFEKWCQWVIVEFVDEDIDGETDEEEDEEEEDEEHDDDDDEDEDDEDEDDEG